MIIRLKASNATVMVKYLDNVLLTLQQASTIAFQLLVPACSSGFLPCNVC